MGMHEKISAAIEAVAACRDRDEAYRVYEEEYLPAALEAISKEATPSDVLVATVGTQPYSVAVSLAYTPAQTVYFIHTDTSRTSAERAWDLASRDGEPHYRPVGKADSVGVYRVIRDIVEAHPGQSVTIDFTSSTKAISGGASALAGYLHLRQIYIESSKIHPDFPLFGDEQAHVVDHPLVVFGDVERREAERAFDRGLFDVAERLFVELEDALARDYHFGARSELCRAYARLQSLEFAKASRSLSSVAETLQKPASCRLRREGLCSLVPRIGAQAEAARVLALATAGESRPAFEADLTNALSRYLLAATRRRLDREPDLAALLAYRALELSLQRRLATHGLDAAALEVADAEALLERYNELCAPGHRISALPKKVAMAQTRTLLIALGDKVLEGLSDITTSKFEGLLGSRNQSIFAHGFQTSNPRNLSSFIELVERHARAVARADELDLPGAGQDPEHEFILLRSLER